MISRVLDLLWKVFIKFRWPDERFIFKVHGSSWIQLHQEKHRTTSKVQIFWEGHNDLAHLPLFIFYYLKVRNFQKQIVKSWILPKDKHFLFRFFVKKEIVRSIFFEELSIFFWTFLAFSRLKLLVEYGPTFCGLLIMSELYRNGRQYNNENNQQSYKYKKSFGPNFASAHDKVLSRGKRYSSPSLETPSNSFSSSNVSVCPV